MSTPVNLADKQESGLRVLLEVVSKCRRQLELMGESAQVSFIVYGRWWGGRDTVRLFSRQPTSPVGQIVGDATGGRPGVIALFSAKEVLAWTLPLIPPGREEAQP